MVTEVNSSARTYSSSFPYSGAIPGATYSRPYGNNERERQEHEEGGNHDEGVDDGTIFSTYSRWLYRKNQPLSLHQQEQTKRVTFLLACKYIQFSLIWTDTETVPLCHSHTREKSGLVGGKIQICKGQDGKGKARVRSFNQVFHYSHQRNTTPVKTCFHHTYIK